MTGNNFSAEAKDRAERAKIYADLAYTILTSPERSAKLSLATGYISCAFSYVTQAQSVLLVHQEADTNGTVSAFIGQFENFADTALAFIGGNKTIDNLETDYSEIQNMLK